MRIQTDKALSQKSQYECGLVDYFQGSKLKVAGKTQAVENKAKDEKTKQDEEKKQAATGQSAWRTA